MEKFRAAICDDEPSDAATLAGLIKECGLPADVSIFESGETLLEAFKPGMFNIVFMDIYLGGLRGIEAARSIRETDPDAVLAFVTNSLDHTLESYRLGALKYLEKPVTMEAVRETLEYALLKRKTCRCISLKTSGGQEEDIPLNSILYFVSLQHIVEIHTFSRLIRTSQSARLDKIEKLLPKPPFFRCHRSFLINLDHAVTIDRDLYSFVMKNGHKAAIRRGCLVKYGVILDEWCLYKAGRDDTWPNHYWN